MIQVRHLLFCKRFCFLAPKTGLRLTCRRLATHHINDNVRINVAFKSQTLQTTVALRWVTSRFALPLPMAFVFWSFRAIQQCFNTCLPSCTAIIAEQCKMALGKTYTRTWEWNTFCYNCSPPRSQLTKNAKVTMKIIILIEIFDKWDHTQRSVV